MLAFLWLTRFCHPPPTNQLLPMETPLNLISLRASALAANQSTAADGTFSTLINQSDPANAHYRSRDPPIATRRCALPFAALEIDSFIAANLGSRYSNFLSLSQHSKLSHIRSCSLLRRSAPSPHHVDAHDV